MKISKDSQMDNNETAKTLFASGVQYHEAGELDKAYEEYRKSLFLDPQNASVWANMGTLLRQKHHFQASAGYTKRAVDLSEDPGTYYTNYGNVLTDMGRKGEALEAHKMAVEASPNSFLAHKNYAVALREFDEHELSLEHLEIACSLEPTNLKALWDRALAYLHLGQFDKGWDAYEVRLKLDVSKKFVHQQPQWEGERFEGKAILVQGEQGFGDTILCSRYLPMIKARGGRVILECKKPLHRLFSNIKGFDRIVEQDKMDESYDYWVPMMSLPRIFKTDLSSIPPLPELFVPYQPPPEAKHLLDLAGERFKVGIVWSGSVTFAGNRKRAVSVERFLPLAEVAGTQFYSLQIGPCEGELADCGGNGLIWELAPHVDDFADTAAVIEELDLIIMTDSSVAHLASSLGKPVWNLLCYSPYWLYLSEREDCPWYESMRLIRQPKAGDWDSVFARVQNELSETVELKKQGKWPVQAAREPKMKKAA